MSFDWPFFWHHLLEPSSLYVTGLVLTVVLSVVSQLIGTALGLAAALARISRFRAAQAVARFYIWVMRGTPLLVQIVFIYTGLAAANLVHFQDIDVGLFVIAGNVQAGILALSLNEGAYMAEIIRAGIASVDYGQGEAASSLGMTQPLLMRRIILPQAVRLIIPPLGNQFNIMLKNSTLVSIIGVPELLLVTETINSATFRTFELYTVVGLYFLTLTTLWGVAQRWIEIRFATPSRDTGGAADSGSRRFMLRNLMNAVTR
jgi:polar amino acid transport system permease protein